MTRHYLDHAATTPLRAVAIEAMTAELGRIGNASSLHGSGRAARRVVEESRELIAACLGARPAELIFTSGGTESDNLAVQGGFFARREQGRPVIISSAVEHHAVLECVAWLGSQHGAEVHEVGVDADGRLDLSHLEELVAEHRDRLGLVTIMTANNETGALQPLPDVVGLGLGLTADLATGEGALLHSDAVQSVGHLPFDFGSSGLDACTVTAHKLGGPIGVGALLLRREAALAPVQHGGGQERDLRSGTLDPAAVAGFAAAVEEATRDREPESRRLAALRDRLLTGVRAVVPDVNLNGPVEAAERLPGVVNLEFGGAASDDVLLLLDRAGIDASSGSACTAGLAQPSHVLLAMGRSETAARSAIRFSFGHTSSAADVDAVLAALPDAVARARLVAAA